VIYLWRYTLIALYTVVWGVLGVLIALVDRSGRGVHWVARTWIHWCLASCGVAVEAQGLENLSPDQPCVIMSNHQSVFDIAALIETLPIPWKFVAKKELLWVPFFGWVLALADQVIIDRGNREKAVRSLARAAARVREGVNVVIFPEGTRSPTAELGEFKSGGFHLALEAGVPVIPVSVSGSRRITPKRSLRVESGRILVRYGKPIPTRGLTTEDRGELKQRVREAILAGFDPELQGPAEPRGR
jgi:1-acyl-sn-glycerol-3-phosphate acyltransferase